MSSDRRGARPGSRHGLPNPELTHRAWRGRHLRVRCDLPRHGRPCTGTVNAATALWRPAWSRGAGDESATKIESGGGGSRGMYGVDS
eukprot:5258363-Pleurochrysis_carterae.AAC.1